MNKLLIALALVPMTFGAAAAAADSPSVTVTPWTGLTDGQVVTVSGTGFPTEGPGFPLPPTAFVQACSSDILDGPQPVSINDALDKCGPPEPNVDTSPNGTFTTTLAVQSEFVSFTGTTVSCAVPGGCAVTAAFWALDSSGLFFVGQVISFGPPTPTSKADCKNGGHKNVVDGQGQPFRNQGQCIDWVNHNT